MNGRRLKVCWPWRLWFLTAEPGHPRGGSCVDCACDVALPKTVGEPPICLYCAIDRGLSEDHPLGGALPLIEVGA